MVKLWLPLVTERYGPEDLEALRQRLQEQDRYTVVQPLTLQRVQLDATGRTLLGGHAFSAAAFGQVCGALAVGLASLVADLSGQRSRLDYPDAAVSVPDAIRAYNAVVDGRFACLDGRQGVYDAQSGVLDGVVAATYRRLPNLELLELTHEALQGAGYAARLLTATLHGRELYLYWLSAPLGQESGPDGPVDIWVGHFFANAEVGTGTVRAAPFLYCNGGAALAPVPRGCRLKHAGRDFSKRLARLLSAVVAEAPAPLAVEGWRSAARARLLGLGDAAQPAKRVRSLGRSLARLGEIPLALTLRCLLTALGSTRPDDLAAQQQRWQGCTLFDLYVAMVQEAVALGNPLQRERLERVAFMALSGRWTPFRPDKGGN